jgi:hypothetical protein
MPKIKSIDNLSNSPQNYVEWEKAISDARKRIKDLKFSIKVFERNRDYTRVKMAGIR